MCLYSNNKGNDPQKDSKLENSIDVKEADQNDNEYTITQDDVEYDEESDNYQEYEYVQNDSS